MRKVLVKEPDFGLPLPRFSPGIPSLEMIMHETEPVMIRLNNQSILVYMKLS